MPTFTRVASAYSIQQNRPGAKLGQQNPTYVAAGEWLVLYRTPISGIPRNATVTNAYLRIAQDRATPGGSRTLSLKEVTSYWSSNVTWNNRPSRGDVVATLTLGPGEVGRYWDFDLTTEVQAIVNGTRDNGASAGWQLDTDEPTPLGMRGTNATFRAPTLFVEYQVVPSKPSNLSPAGGAVSDTHPWLSFDDDDGVTGVQVQIDPESDAADPDWDSGTVVTSGGAVDLASPYFPAPFPGLVNGATTFWRARQRSTGGWSAWSEWVDISRIADSGLTITQPPSESNAPIAEWDFEATLDTWEEQGGGTLTLEDDESRGGLQSAYIVGGTSARTIVSSLVDLNTAYVFRCWVYVPAAASENANLWVGGPGVVLPANYSSAVRDAWVLLQAPFTTTGSTGTVQLQVTSGTTGRWFDEASLWLASAPFPPTGAAGHTEVADGTPPITWTFEGSQMAWQAILYKADGTVLSDSGFQPGSDTGWNPPKGLTKDGQKGRIEVRVWDDEERIATSTAPGYVITDLDITLDLDPTVDPVTGLTATQDGYSPNVVLSGTRSTLPDELEVYRNVGSGFVLLGRYLATDVFDGTTFTVVDRAPIINKETTYRVQARVNGKTGSSGPTVSITPNCLGIWLTDLASGDQAVIRTEGRPTPEQTQPESSIVHAPVGEVGGEGQIVRRRLVRYRPQGVVDGVLFQAQENLPIPTAVESEALLRSWVEFDAGHRYQLSFAGFTSEVIVGDITFSERDDNRPGRRALGVSFNWYGQAA